MIKVNNLNQNEYKFICTENQIHIIQIIYMLLLDHMYISYVRNLFESI